MKRHAFWWIPEFVSVALFKVKKYAKTSKVTAKLKAWPCLWLSMARMETDCNQVL